ncbi:MAG: dihydroorotase, partial [Nitrososphaeraceae archaeon]
MNNTCDTLICDASLVVPNKGILPDVNILIENGKIKGVQSSVNNVCADKKISVNGKYVLPGVIDP